MAKEREKTINNWVSDKIKQTYVRMSDRYKTVISVSRLEKMTIHPFPNISRRIPSRA
jgi:hypothetical protein